METLFTWTTAQFGLAVGLLIVAVVILGRIVAVQNREAKAQYERSITELETERDLYRDKWIEAVGAAEIGEQASKRLVAGRRRPGGH